MPHPFPARKSRGKDRLRATGTTALAAILLIIGILSLPKVLATDIEIARSEPAKTPFPVTVDPVNETIIEDPEVEELLSQTHGFLAAAAFDAAESAFSFLANLVASLPLYQQIAGSDIAFVEVKAGYREEEVARAFARELGWSTKEQQTFLTQVHNTDPELSEGEFVPGTYAVSAAATPSYVQELLADRFDKDIESRYSTSTEEVLPLEDALTIASMLERETRDPSEMRLISGIIWNRLWSGMNLQIDATLQYAKATKTKNGVWWPKVVPNDKYVKSPYNTYAHEGLPPGPIASPSTEAILAALNPKKTDCLFYFHDKRGEMHCTETYKEHVALLKKYYGQGR